MTEESGDDGSSGADDEGPGTSAADAGADGADPPSDADADSGADTRDDGREPPDESPDPDTESGARSDEPEEAGAADKGESEEAGEEDETATDPAEPDDAEEEAVEGADPEGPEDTGGDERADADPEESDDADPEENVETAPDEEETSGPDDDAEENGAADAEDDDAEGNGAADAEDDDIPETGGDSSSGVEGEDEPVGVVTAGDQQDEDADAPDDGSDNSTPSPSQFEDPAKALAAFSGRDPGAGEGDGSTAGADDADEPTDGDTDGEDDADLSGDPAPGTGDADDDGEPTPAESISELGAGENVAGSDGETADGAGVEADADADAGGEADGGAPAADIVEEGAPERSPAPSDPMTTGDETYEGEYDVVEGSREGPPDDEEMPLADHIEEMLLRLAVVSAVAAVVAGTLFFMEPLAENAILFVWNSVLPDTAAARPRVYGPLELKLTELKFASLAGFVVALPVFVYETYRFMRPGLYPHERRYYLAAVPTSLVLAFIGISFSYFLVLPAIFVYFIRYSERAGTLAFALRQTFDLILVLMGFMALVFQIPLFIMLAIMMDIADRRWMEERRLYFWGGFLGVAFLFSPDPTGMAPIIVALTMVGLFEGTLALLRWTGN